MSQDGLSPWVQLGPGVEMRQVGDPGLYEIEVRRIGLNGDWVTWRVANVSSTWRPDAGMHGEVRLDFMRVKR